MKSIKFLLYAFSIFLAAQACAQPSQREQLSEAIWKSNTDVVGSLIASGVSRKTRDANGFLPLVSAVIVGSQPDKEKAALEMIRLLIDAGADVNADGPAGTTPLAAACSQTRSVPIVEFLLNRGAKVNANGYNGTTPLYQAVRKKNAAIAELLINRGANVKARSGDGETILHYAALNNMQSTADLLLARGAEINARDNEGKTPLAWSQGNLPSSFIGTSPGNSSMTEFLRQRGASE
jgi:ankyrin repeat protein